MAILFASPVDDPDTWRTALSALVPDLDFRVHPQIGRAEEIELALVWKPPAGALSGLPRLKAILALGAGVDGLLADTTLPDVPICRMIDPALTLGMCDYVLAAVLRHHRRFDHFERCQRRRVWDFAMPRLARHRTVGVMGLGELGGAVARALAAHGFQVRGWSRSPREIEGVACLHGEDRLPVFLERCEILVSLLPSTTETRGILDAGLLASLPEGAYLINAARGALLVEEDLLAALASGRIAGATLDVFHQEPLPQDHPFWAEERILVTPHAASYSDASTGAGHVAENIRRARAGLPLLGLVDRARGY